MLYSIFGKNFWLLAVSSSAAVLTRQYNVFLTASVICYFGLSYFLMKEKQSLKPVALVALSIIPLLFLFYLWKGIAPQTGLDKWTTGNEEIKFNISNLTTYITFLTFYSFPFIIYSSKNIYNFIAKKKYVLIVIFLISLVYCFFPVVYCSVPDLYRFIPVVFFSIPEFDYRFPVV